MLVKIAALFTSASMRPNRASAASARRVSQPRRRRQSARDARPACRLDLPGERLEVEHVGGDHRPAVRGKGLRVGAAEALRRACHDRYPGIDPSIIETSVCPVHVDDEERRGGATSGREEPVSGARSARLGPAERAAARAWEVFAGGGDVVEGVRPEIVDSWARCRDDFGIETTRDRAQPAEPDPALAPEESVVAAELGAAAMTIAPRLAELRGVVVVADGRGRMLSAWGDEHAERRGREQNLGPLYSWAEASTGTTGVGTALVARGPVAVRRFEHWCAAFHDWSCAAVAVRRPDGSPIGVVGISVWGRPSRARGRLARRCGVRCRAAARASRRRSRAARRSRPRSPRPSSPAASRASALGGRSSCRSTRCTSSSFEHGLVWLGTSEVASAPRRAPRRARGTARACGLPRVSRTAIVNLHRVREIAPSFKGGVWVVTDGGASVAVSEAPRAGASSRPRPRHAPVRSRVRPLAMPGRPLVAAAVPGRFRGAMISARGGHRVRPALARAA